MMLVPCGVCMIVFSILFLVLGVLAIVDYGRFDPFYRHPQCTNLFIAMPVPAITGFKTVDPDGTVPFKYAMSFTVAAGPGGLVQGEKADDVMMAMMKGGALNGALGLPATAPLDEPTMMAKAAALNPALVGADAMTVKGALVNMVDAAVANMTASAIAQGQATIIAQVGSYPRAEVTKAAYDAAAHVPVSMICTNPNDFDLTLKAGGTSGGVFIPLGPGLPPSIKIGDVVVNEKAKLEMDKPTKVSLGLKMQLVDGIAAAFYKTLMPAPGTFGIAPLFFTLAPLKSTLSSQVMGMNDNQEDQVPDHYCGLLMKTHVIPAPPPGDGTPTPHLMTSSPTLCSHSWAALMPRFTPEMIAKYDKHTPAAPLSDVPMKPEQSSAGFISDFAADPKKVQDAEDQLNFFFTLLISFSFVMFVVLMGLGILAIIVGVKKQRRSTKIADTTKYVEKNEAKEGE